MDKLSTPPDKQHSWPSRSQIARDMLVFHVKLFFDGLKDVVLVPLSLVAGLVGILSSSKESRRYLYTVMRMGKGFDDWVDLYSTGNADKELKAGGRAGNLDQYVNRVEKAVLDAHERSRPPGERKRDKP